MIVNDLLSDEDDSSLDASHLSSGSYSESAYSDSSETDENFNNDTFAASRSATVCRTIRTRGGVRRQPISRPAVQNLTQASDPQELQQLGYQCSRPLCISIRYLTSSIGRYSKGRRSNIFPGINTNRRTFSGYTKACNHPRPSTTTHNHQKLPTITHNYPQPTTISQSHPKITQ